MEDQFVTVLTPARPGDYNADGAVDSLDYAVWRSAVGSENLAADGNVDGKVDGADYVLWRSNAATAPAAASGSTTSIPEPATVALMLCPAAAMLYVRRYRRG
jgi:hypothetical protein